MKFTYKGVTHELPEVEQIALVKGPVGNPYITMSTSSKRLTHGRGWNPIDNNLVVLILFSRPGYQFLNSGSHIAQQIRRGEHR